MNERKEYLDMMRGIAILLVVLEHCVGYTTVPLARVILSFHMPLFFFISGCCFSVNRPFFSFLARKSKTILIPQITLGIITIASVILFDVFLKKTISINEVPFAGAFHFWFLPVLFMMEMFMYPIIKFIKSKMMIIIVTLFIFVVFCLCEFDAMPFAHQTIAALIFGLTGFLSTSFIEKISKKTLIGGGGLCC